MNSALVLLVGVLAGAAAVVALDLVFDVSTTLRRLLARARGVPDDRRVRDQALRALVRAETDGDELESEESLEMLAGIFELGDTRVREVMVPRLDVTALPRTATLDEALTTIIEAGHSRIPVFDETIDHVVGVLYAKDLLPAFRDRRFDVQLVDLLRPPHFVPESKPVDELLRELQRDRVHLAIVVDEYGGTAGLVSIEDVIEEIVGEIQDEYDETEEPDILAVDPVGGIGTFRASIDIDDVNRMLDIDLPSDGDVDTVGGLVYSQLGKVPAIGDRAHFVDADVEVLAVSGRRVEQVRVVRRTAGDYAGDEARC